MKHTTPTPFRIARPHVRWMLVFAALSVIGTGCSNKMSQAESDSREALRELGAITVLDAEGIHVATLMMSSPTIQNKMDEAIPHVANLPYLTHLDVTGANLTDEHMKTIGGLKRLTSLVLSGTQVGDAGLKCVGRRGIDALYVDNTKITPSSMDVIGDINTLKILDISSSDVMSNLAPITNLKNLEWLVIENTSIDKAAIDIIRELELLRRFSIKGSTVEIEDLSRLKSAKPSLMIDESAEQPSDGAPAENERTTAKDAE